MDPRSDLGTRTCSHTDFCASDVFCRYKRPGEHVAIRSRRKCSRHNVTSASESARRSAYSCAEMGYSFVKSKALQFAGAAVVVFEADEESDQYAFSRSKRISLEFLSLVVGEKKNSETMAEYPLGFKRRGDKARIAASTASPELPPAEKRPCRAAITSLVAKSVSLGLVIDVFDGDGTGRNGGLAVIISYPAPVVAVGDLDTDKFRNKSTRPRFGSCGEETDDVAAPSSDNETTRPVPSSKLPCTSVRTALSLSSSSLLSLNSISPFKAAEKAVNRSARGLRSKQTIDWHFFSASATSACMPLPVHRSSQHVLC